MLSRFLLRSRLARAPSAGFVKTNPVCRPKFRHYSEGTHYFQNQARKSRKWPWFLGGSLLGVTLYWKWLTHHNYPKEVADKLRDGLMAEINGAGYRKSDNKKALQAYLEALFDADELEMDPISNEYTGIQLKIAEMYERLELTKEALFVYLEILGTYLMALMNNKVPVEQRESIIERDLRIAVISAIYLAKDPTMGMKLLLPHIAMAQKESAVHSAEIAHALQLEADLEFGKVMRGEMGDIKFTDELEAGWGSYKNELFALREMYAGLSLSVGDFLRAGAFKQQTTRLMLASGFPEGDCLLSMVNCASLGLLHGDMQKAYAERLLAEQAKNDATAVESSTDSETPKSNDGQVTLEIEGGEPLLSSDKSFDEVYSSVVRESAPEEVSTDIKEIHDVYSQSLDSSYKIYTTVRETVEKLGAFKKRTGLVPYAYAMSIYGQGLVELQRQNWSAASDLLNEAKIRARGLQIEPLLLSVEDELQKLEKLKDIKDTDAVVSASQLPKVDVMFWKMEPADWASTNSGSDDIKRF